MSETASQHLEGQARSKAVSTKGASDATSSHRQAATAVHKDEGPNRGASTAAPASNGVEASPQETRPRVRMSKEDRRRQLIGIGLRALTERPIQEVSLDSVAQEAGISRGLLFHYFPTKTAFYEAVVRAAGRRVLRTVAPDPGVSAQEALSQLLSRYIAQIDRRRALYSALVQGNLADLGAAEVAGGLRAQMANIAIRALEEEGERPQFDVVHAWLAYVEDVALRWSEAPVESRAIDVDGLAEHCTLALKPLLKFDFVLTNQDVRLTE